jgi:hypothetical protein
MDPTTPTPSSGWRRRLIALALALPLASAVGACSKKSGGSVQSDALPSSLELIAQAHAAGAIDDDTTLLYQLYVIFQSNLLPEQYVGDDSALILEGTSLLSQAFDRYPALTPEMQAKFDPFLVRPTDPRSVLAPAPPSGALSPSPNPGCGDILGWDCIDVPNLSIRFWYPSLAVGGAMPGQDAATYLAQEVPRMFDLESQAMLGKVPCSDARSVNDADNGFTGALDVYLVDVNTPAPRLLRNGMPAPALPANDLGRAFRTNSDSGCARFLTLNLTALGTQPLLRQAMAHELFHAFQTAWFPGQRNDVEWWVEASADWAIDLVYPGDNFEWTHLSHKRSLWSAVSRTEITPDGPLDDAEAGTIKPYSSYLWPFLMTRARSLPPTYVGTVWQAVPTTAPLDFMASRTDWIPALKDFALRNLNRVDMKKYPDQPGDIPRDVLSQKIDTATIAKGSMQEVQVNVPHAGVDYPIRVAVKPGAPPNDKPPYLVKVSDLAIFNAGGLLQAVFEGSDGTFVAEDWDDGAFEHYASLSADGHLILLVANPNTVNPINGSLTVEVLAGGDALFTYDGTTVYTTAPGCAQNQISSPAVPCSGPPVGCEYSGQFQYHQHISSVWQIQLTQVIGDQRTYTFNSTNTISLSGGGQEEYKTPIGPLLVTGQASDQVTGQATTHNPARADELDFGVAVAGSIQVSGNQAQLSWDLSEIRLMRTWHLQDSSGREESYSDAIPGIQVTDNGTMSTEPNLDNMPAHECLPVGASKVYTSTVGADGTIEVVFSDVLDQMGVLAENADPGVTCYPQRALTDTTWDHVVTTYRTTLRVALPHWSQ